MSDLRLSFSELYQEVEKFLGTYASGSATAVDVTDAKFIVNRAYSRFVSYYDWTFLSQEKTLKTNDKQFRYNLPSEFNYLLSNEMSFDDNEFYRECTQRSTKQIREMRADDVYNNYPLFFALQAGSYTKETGQQWELQFYPTPNSNYLLHYFCKITPQKLENDSDVPIGGPEMSDCLLELCLAYAESYKDERQAVHHALLREILSPAKVMDSRRRSAHLGSMIKGDRDMWDINNVHNGNVVIST